jgi:hypothetical protein
MIAHDEVSLLVEVAGQFGDAKGHEPQVVVFIAAHRDIGGGGSHRLHQA